MKIKGLIFDLDGTLLDSMHCWENVDRSFLIENGINPPAGISDIVKKMTIQASANYFKTQFSLRQSCEDIINRIEEIVREQYYSSIPLKEGVYETINKLKSVGYRMCVATATYNRLASAALKRLGIIDCFEFILTCSDVGAGKDRPDIFIEAAKKMDCTESNALVVEDSLHCIETAAAAGFYTAAVYDRFSENEWDRICSSSWKNIRNISEITEILGKENV